jgi:hypothetical protein
MRPARSRSAPNSTCPLKERDPWEKDASDPMMTPSPPHDTSVDLCGPGRAHVPICCWHTAKEEESCISSLNYNIHLSIHPSR